MKRFGISFLGAILSVLLLISTIIWLRSYWVGDRFAWKNRGWPSTSISIFQGSIFILRAKSDTDRFEYTQVPSNGGPLWSESKPKWSFGGFAYYEDSDVKRGFGPPITPIPYTEYVAPIWSLEILNCICFFLWLRGFLRKGGFAEGFCPGCGYDLRSTPNRCPECGWKNKKV